MFIRKVKIRRNFKIFQRIIRRIAKILKISRKLKIRRTKINLRVRRIIKKTVGRRIVKITWINRNIKKNRRRSLKLIRINLTKNISWIEVNRRRIIIKDNKNGRIRKIIIINSAT